LMMLRELAMQYQFPAIKLNGCGGR
jgi:hypothetical protein